MPNLLLKTLGVICPACDTLNGTGAVRCAACGASTGTGPQHAAATHPAAAPLTPPGLRRNQPDPPAPAAAQVAGSGRPSFQSSAAPSSAAPSSAAPSTTSAAGRRFGLTVLAGPSRGQRFKLGAHGAQVGRSRGAILFPEDPCVSPLHATLVVRDGQLYVRDENSTSGIYVSITGSEVLAPKATFCAGSRRFRYRGRIDPAAPWNRSDVLVYGAPLPNSQVHYAFEEVLLGDRPARCLLTPGPLLTIGQARCDFAYPNDEGLAARHCEVSTSPTGAVLRDLSGGLGTFVRIGLERALKSGDRIRIGQQTLLMEAIS